jgi:protein-disulfide isomerase
MSRRRTSVPATLGLAALVALVAACGGEGEGDVADTSSLSASMLDARTDPGLGTGPSVPVGGGVDGSSTAAPRSVAPEEGEGPARQEAGAPRGPAGGAAGSRSGDLSLANLGFDSGAGDAPVQIVEFSDFGCGYCARFHDDVYPTLEREYVQSGKVAWKYVPMVLGIFGPNAEAAARAGECAGEQGRFPGMRDLLFEGQRDWKRADDTGPIFEGYARSASLDLDRFRRCVDEGWRDDRVVAGTRLSRQVGVRGTPTFFVVGYAPIPGALPLDLFRQVLDTVYAERTAGRSGAGPAPGGSGPGGR